MKRFFQPRFAISNERYPASNTFVSAGDSFVGTFGVRITEHTPAVSCNVLCVQGLTLPLAVQGFAEFNVPSD